MYSLVLYEEAGKQALPFHKADRCARWVLLAAAVNALFQVYWFSRNGLHQIDFDGMDYVGIARHIRQGEIFASINGFRSPLISWLIAAASSFSQNLLLVGKAISISSFLLLILLTYMFAKSLWWSEIVGSLAAFWLTLCRGLPAIAVLFVTPDFLFAALTVLYFWVLLACFRRDKLRSWLLLGTFHGLAFLCKAFALPWLSLATILALLLRQDRSLKSVSTRFAAAMLVPVIAAGAWALVLHSKYGVFTTGTQFKTNFLQWTLHEYRQRHDLTYAVLVNQAPITDRFMVTDLMAPGSWAWRYKINWPRALPNVVASEKFYVPQAAKEILILITPGGLLGLLVVGFAIIKGPSAHPAELRLIIVVGVSAVTLVLAYCMLVFDGRYVYPLLPLLLPISARGLVPDPEPSPVRIPLPWRFAMIAFALGGVLFSALYWASPFRTLRHDYQAICYDAAAKLRQHPGVTAVTLGAGPYPEHGVGWEAGLKASFFGDRQIIARLDELPTAELLPETLADITKARANAVLVWGSASDTRYLKLVSSLSSQYPGYSQNAIDDPTFGEVGTIFISTNASPGRSGKHF